MNKVIAVLGTIAVGSVIVGCSTVDPRTIPQTSRDKEVYTPVAERPVPEEQYKIAIVAKVDNKLSPMPGKDADADEKVSFAREAELIPYVAEQMDTSLAQNFNNLGWFETVDRSHGMALAAEAVLSGDKDAFNVDKYSKADLVIFAESHLTWFAAQGWKTTGYASKARGAGVKTDFRLIDVKTKQPLIVKQITSRIADAGKGRDILKGAIQNCCDQNAAKFARIIAGKFLPEVRVKETRGSGRYALVSMGRNFRCDPETASWKWWPYQYLPLCYVKTTDLPATRVDFCYTEKAKGPGGKDKFDSVNFAYGKVVQSDAKTAWVEVENYETAGVKQGHSAVVSDQTMGGQEIQ